MIEQYKETIERYISGSLSRDELLNELPTNFKFEDKFNLLLEVKLLNRPDLFESIFWVFPPSDSDSHLVLSRWALLEQWHFKHEEIIGSFQSRFKNRSENIDFILEAMKNVPKYLNSGELKDSYLRKCMYALAAQPLKEALELLKRLQENNDEIIAKYAKDQLSKIDVV